MKKNNIKGILSNFISNNNQRSWSKSQYFRPWNFNKEVETSLDNFLETPETQDILNNVNIQSAHKLWTEKNIHLGPDLKKPEKNYKLNAK